MVVVGFFFFIIFACCGLVVEILAELLKFIDFCSPPTSTKRGGLGRKAAGSLDAQ